ncbi:hypothetical protein PoB_006418600 [Plakobranchus ocellatus]|uniref:Uncharacterized protein n=1 Tax=Plakobranchus ocellatus TaxID=259542 RepID=A0AAV4D118_9GAST|nr:hypothetical protein PoB_006418600 [Plakobranchus ocellatus]
MSTVAVQTDAPWTYRPLQGQATMHIGDWCLTALFLAPPQTPPSDWPFPITSGTPAISPCLSTNPWSNLPSPQPILPILVHRDPYNFPLPSAPSPAHLPTPFPSLRSLNISIPPGLSELPQP